MTFWLLQAMNDIDPDLVERAAQRPRKVYPLRWVAAVAAAAVMVVGVGVWWQHRPEDQPPIAPPDNTTTTTTTMGTTTTVDGIISTQTTTAPTPTETTTTTTNDGGGVGGDEWSCDGCSPWYHNFDGELLDYIGWDRFDQWNASTTRLPPDRTYPYHDCRFPDSNIISCVEYFDITREQFIKAMGWEDVLDRPFDSMYNEDEPSPYLYTYGDYLDAIYGDDPHLTAWVFGASIAEVETYEDDWQYQRYYLPDYDMFYPDPVTLYAGGDPWTEGGKVNTFIALYGRGEEGSIIHFVDYFDISREKFIELDGWGDKLDEKATYHFEYAPYTYRQFVDAIYGDDQALRDWVFDCYVFHPDYPKSP